MVLGFSRKAYKHMMKNMVTSLIQFGRIQTTNAKAKRLVKAGNKLIHYAKRAERGQTGPMNMLKGRVSTKKALNKLLMQVAPRLALMNQNYVKMTKIIRRRRGDNAPMVIVSIRGDERQQNEKIQRIKQLQKSGWVDEKAYSRKILNQQKAYLQKQITLKPQMEIFLKQKIARVEFELWVLDKPAGEKRLALLV